MKKQTEKARTPYGEYTVSHETPDRDVFRLRLEALRRHEGFREYCEGPEGTKEQEKKSFREMFLKKADFEEWIRPHLDDHLKLCFLIYGNVHRMKFKTAWARFIFTYALYCKAYGARPIMELRPGTVVPDGRLSISMDPHIRRDELVRMFEKFLTSRRKAFTREAGGDSLRGYFQVTEKRFDIDTTRRYLDVHRLRREIEKKRLQAGGGRTDGWTAKKWREEVFKKFPELYAETDTSKKKQEKANKELKYAENIIAWAVRGRFPCTKPLK